MFLDHHLKFLIIAGMCLLTQVVHLKGARADSPLTSTNLTGAYQDLSVVRLAQQEKTLQGEILGFLLGNAPLDQKAAVINALGTQFEGQNNGYLFLTGLATKRGIKLENITLRDLTPADRFVLGYLLAMDDYFEMSPLRPGSTEELWGASPLELLSQAASALPDNFTVYFIRSLVQAQSDFSRSWCSVYLSPSLVLRLFPPGKRNMRQDAIAEAMDYINLYQPNCKTSSEK